jgi:hypothetical protein
VGGLNRWAPKARFHVFPYASWIRRYMSASAAENRRIAVSVRATPSGHGSWVPLSSTTRLADQPTNAVPSSKTIASLPSGKTYRSPSACRSKSRYAGCE